MSTTPDILLINIGGTKKRVYQDLSADFSAVEPPFWLLLTAGYLRKQGFTVEALDANVLNLDEQETVDAVVARKARLNAIIVYSQQANTCTPIMGGVSRLCRALKNRQADLPLILTGWHPSCLPERTLREEACDMVAEGEGFYTLRGLLRGDPLDTVPGLWWREGDGIRHNPRAPNIENLSEELDEVAWDLLPIDGGGYRAFNWLALSDLPTRTHCAGLFTSLGCPYQCSFCAIHATFGERRIRYWSPEWTMKQLDILARRYGVRHVNLIDELYVFNPKHYLPIAEALLQREYKLNFCAFARVDRVDKMPMEELRLLKKTGFNWFKLGIEHSDETVLHLAHKGNYVREDIRRVVGKIHEAGIDLCANFMFGLPGDTWETMQSNFNFAMELNCAFPSFFCTMAPPGSDLYDEALANGTPLPADWEGYAQQGYNFQPLPTEHLTPAEVLAFRDWAFQTYFTNPRYLDMIARKFGPGARDHIRAMTAVRLKRRLLGD